MKDLRRRIGGTIKELGTVEYQKRYRAILNEERMKVDHQATPEIAASCRRGPWDDHGDDWMEPAFCKT